MNRPSLLVVFLLVACLSLGASCRKTGSTASPAVPASTPPSGSPTAPLHQPAGGPAPVGQTRYFKGSIGSTLGLQMKLTRDGDRLSGSYYYQKVGTNIDLRGTVDQEGNLMLEEFDPDGKQTGVFKGLWQMQDDGLVGIAGNWSKPNSDKMTAFSVHEEPIQFSGTLELVAKQIKESNKKLSYEIDAEYPQLTGSAEPRVETFNREARNLVIRQVAEFRKDMADREKEDLPGDTGQGSDISIFYNISLANDDLISIQFQIGGYYAGAAHPNSNTRVVNYDLKNGKVLRLADLFRPGAKYLAAISAHCIKDLKRQAKADGQDSMLEADMIEQGAGPASKNFSSWTVGKKGLEITFDAYQVAPYAAGPQAVTIPFAVIKEIINPDGPVGSLAK
jgi:Protein of unknown function (DUF3298)/Deacetylase PdaC